jgi:sRNA-binding protein
MDDTTGETKRRGRMPPEEWQARRRQGEVLIVALASLFPNCFTVEKWKPHRPLKVGVSRDLADLGVVTDAEAHLALSVYTARLTYQECLAAGGPRYDLSGEPVGVVSDDDRENGRKTRDRLVHNREKHAAGVKAERIAAAAQKRAARNDSGPVRDAATPDADIVAERCAVEPVKPDGIKRLGLSDLKRAALARRQAQLVAAE